MGTIMNRRTLSNVSNYGNFNNIENFRIKSKFYNMGG